VELDERHYHWSLYYSLNQWRMLVDANLINDQMKNTRNRKVVVQIVLGAIATVAFNLVLFVIFLMLGSGTLYSLAFMPLLTRAVFQIGFSQLIYIVPLCLYLNRKQQWNWMKGIIIGACITALLNGGCWLILQNSLTHY
jgi:hypothetical protein